MSKTNEIFFGWGIAAFMAVSTIVCLPEIAVASANMKEKTRWETRARAFQDFSMKTRSNTTFVANLTQSVLSQDIENPWKFDVQAIGFDDTASLLTKSKTLQREVQCLSEAIYHEARSETLAGQKAVAEVVLNRVKSKHFPNTVCGVVYQGAQRTSGCQFSFTCDGSRSVLPKKKTWNKSRAIADHMMMGISAPLTNRSTHYHTTNVHPKWAADLRQTRQYGIHVFYRFMPRKSSMHPVSVAP
ncbi:MAG: cell wall hydrolase [Robiginitomaculum sp.]